MSPIPDDERAPRRTAQYSSSNDASGGLPPELNPRRGTARAAVASPRVRPRRRRPARVLAWIAISLSALVFLGTGGAYLAFLHFNGQITRLGGITNGNTDNSPSVNYLVVGVDSREGANGTLGAGTTADVQGLRTDTMMLIHVSKKAAKATIVSFPRDSYVAIPGHGSTKLNAAVPLGGPALLVQTLQALTGLQIDHYVQVDFQGFLAMTNAVGGVDICLNSAAYDKESGIDLSAGTHHISGAMALAFVRQRYGLPQGDLDRIKHQQVFIGALVRRITSAGTLLNPFKLTRLLDTATKAVKVDDHLTTSDMKTLAQRLRHLDPGHVQFETIPVRGTGLAGAAGSVVFLDTDKLKTFFSDIDNDVIASPTPTPQVGSKPLTIAPGNIHVTVLNGTGIAGKARTAADSLTSVGFGIAGTGNATGGTYPKSVVRYGPSRSDSARTLAAAVPGSVLEPDAALGSSLTLVVGQNFSGAKNVTIGGGASTPTSGATASATSSPKPPSVTAASNGCAPGNNG